MKVIFLALVALFISFTSFSQSISSQDHARELLVMMGTGKLATQLMDRMVANYRNLLPDVPEEFWDEVIDEVKEDELIELIVPVYAKHFTNDELVQMIEFYKTPLGKKIIEKLPLISQDSRLLGEKWGKEIAERVVSKLRMKGYVKNI